jgi:site-specific recombinase XerD
MKSTAQHVLEWLEYLRKQNYSPESIRTYGQRIERFVQFVTVSRIKDIRVVDRDLVRRFWHALLTRPKKLSVNSLGSECRAIKSFFAYLNNEGEMGHDPSTVLVDPSLKNRLPIPAPKHEDVMKVLKQPDSSTPLGIRDRAVIEILYSTGMRGGECSNLLLDDMDLQDGIIRIRKGKGKKQREVPLGIESCRAVRKYLEESRPFYRTVCGPESVNFLFLARFGRHMTAEDIRNIFRKYRILAGVHKITPHAVRRAAATGMISRAGKAAADIGAVQQMLGHSRVDVTARYAQVLGEDLSGVHNQLHPRSKTKDMVGDPKEIKRLRYRCD